MNIILAPCRDVEVWGVELEGEMELVPWVSCLTRLVTTPDQANELFRDAVRRLNQRAGQMVGKWQRLWEPTPAEPAMVIIVDEYAEMPGELTAAPIPSSGAARPSRST